eukprot:COSAG02_NODE_52289_length_308_cov_1.813397_1_plen_77_part_01
MSAFQYAALQPLLGGPTFSPVNVPTPPSPRLFAISAFRRVLLASSYHVCVRNGLPTGGVMRNGGYGPSDDAGQSIYG